MGGGELWKAPGLAPLAVKDVPEAKNGAFPQA
jgi:hypothetical protein